MANENKKLSTEGRSLIEQWEGLHLTSYQDIGGIWTIGYGHTGGVKPNTTITREEANRILDEDVKIHAKGITNFITVELSQHQYDALVSFHFNLGVNILEGTTLLNYLNSRQWQAAANEMMAYINVNGSPVQGLINRRRSEVALFLSDDPIKPLDPKRNFGVKISYFLENEVLEKLTEFRSAFPQYSACLEYAGNQKYSIVIQPFTYLEVNAKKMEIQGKFPHWTMAVAELVDFSTRKALLIAPFKGVEVGEAFLKIKKRFGFSMTINPSPYGDAGRVDYSKELNKNSIVVSPFSSGEALDKLNEFKKAFPSYAANTFLEQRLENAEQYHLVIQPFAPVEVKDAFNEINGRFPSWIKNIQAFHNVGDPKAILISPFTGSEVTEKYLLVKKEFGYSMEIVDV